MRFHPLCRIVAVLGAVSLKAQAQAWPIVQPLSAAVTFTNPGKNGTDTPFTAVIRDTGGKIAYTVECHNGNYDDESKINFSSDFQCALFSNGRDTLQETDFNLLVSPTKLEESSDDYNRAVMISQQLAGECADYPEYGAVRTFRLRGMLVTFKFTDLQWAPPSPAPSIPRAYSGYSRLRAFTFTLSVARDPTAKTPRAEIVHIRRPPAFCYPVG
jgi:hypothetical protein